MAGQVTGRDELVVALDPAYLPGIIAAEAEIERKDENERFAVWEHGFRAGTFNALEREPGEPHKKNPYQSRPPTEAQPLPSPYRFIERIQRGEFDRYLERIISAAHLRKAQL